LPQKKVLVNCEIYGGEALSLYIEELTGVRCRFNKPSRGETKKLADMSESNAKDFLVKSKDEEARKYMMTLGAVEMLKDIFNLPRLPLRIECYDISNISGVDKVASQVVFTDGKPDKKQYRRFKIKTVEGADDFASMEEVLSRRLQRLLDKDELFGSMPDLIVVDGGKGQLSSAQKAFDKKGVSGIPLISLAKKEEIVYTFDGREVRLARNSYALKLLTAVRDEAHRYAVSYFRQLHSKNALKSLLSDIKGVGKKRQIELVRHFNNIERISAATAEEISQVKGMNLVTAQNIYKYFNG
jgi:excinuclease ABC subunit C